MITERNLNDLFEKQLIHKKENKHGSRTIRK